MFLQNQETKITKNNLLFDLATISSIHCYDWTPWNQIRLVYMVIFIFGGSCRSHRTNRLVQVNKFKALLDDFFFFFPNILILNFTFPYETWPPWLLTGIYLNKIDTSRMFDITWALRNYCHKLTGIFLSPFGGMEGSHVKVAFFLLLPAVQLVVGISNTSWVSLPFFVSSCVGLVDWSLSSNFHGVFRWLYSTCWLS